MSQIVRSFPTIILSLMLGLSLTSAAASTRNSDSERKLPPAEDTFTLKVGEEHVTAGPSIRLVRIVRDERCLKDARCGWPGDLEAELEVRDGDAVKSYSIGISDGRSIRVGKDLTPGNPSVGPVILGHSEIQLIKVKPKASAQQVAELPPEKYTLTFKWLPNPPLIKDESRDAYEIYSVALANNSHKQFGPPSAIADLTFSLPPVYINKCIHPAGDGKRLYREVIADYNRRNVFHYHLENWMDGQPGYELLDSEEAESLQKDLFHGSQRGPLAFEILYKLSAVGFDKSRTRALVGVISSCGNVCGGMNYYFFKKVNDAWVQDDDFKGKMCWSIS